MAGKLSGLAGAVTVADTVPTVRDISEDVTNWTLSTPRGVQDVTGVNRSAHERILLLSDISFNVNGVFDDTAGASSHAVFSTVPSTSVARACNVVPTADTAHLPFNALFTDYQLTRTATGEVTYQAPGVLSDGTVPTWA